MVEIVNRPYAKAFEAFATARPDVLCLSADLLGDELIDRMVRIWLETPFEGGRHARRVEKIVRFEAALRPPGGGGG